MPEQRLQRWPSPLGLRLGCLASGPRGAGHGKSDLPGNLGTPVTSGLTKGSRDELELRGKPAPPNIFRAEHSSPLGMAPPTKRRGNLRGCSGTLEKWSEAFPGQPRRNGKILICRSTSSAKFAPYPVRARPRARKSGSSSRRLRRLGLDLGTLIMLEG